MTQLALAFPPTSPFVDDRYPTFMAENTATLLAIAAQTNRRPRGRRQAEDEARSLLDQVFPPEQCDEKRGDEWAAIFLASEDRRRRMWPELYDDGEVA